MRFGRCSKRALFGALLATILCFAQARGAMASGVGDDCCEDRIAVDADDAYERAQRRDRDPVEGLWVTYIYWHPELDAARSYRMAIVRNTYGVFEDAEYIGVATCEQTGCVKGEVKLLLRRTDEPNAFDASMVTNAGFGRGTAVLTADPDDGRADSAIDMRGVRYGEHTMAKWIVRVIDG